MQSEAPNEKASIISLIFPNEDVKFFETDEIDIAQIESEIEREIAEEERINALTEKKRQEKEELQRSSKAFLAWR